MLSQIQSFLKLEKPKIHEGIQTGKKVTYTTGD